MTIDQEYIEVMYNADSLVFGELTLTLVHFLAKLKFSTGYEGAHNTLGNPRGVGRLFFQFRKVEIPERFNRGLCMKFLL